MLKYSYWQVTLGKGLDFEIKILPWAAREIYYDQVLISPPPVISLPTKYLDKAAVIELKADLRKRTREDRERTREDGERIREDGKIPRARALNILIGKTRQILVFKEAT